MADENMSAPLDAGKQASERTGSVDPNVMQDMPEDSSVRTEPIHPLITEVRLSSNMVRPTNRSTPARSGSGGRAHLTQLHPVTSHPFTLEELRAHKIESLLSQYPTSEVASQAREDTVRELRKLLDENEEKNKRIDHELEEKEKTREIERKVYASGRKLGKDV